MTTTQVIARRWVAFVFGLCGAFAALAQGTFVMPSSFANRMGSQGMALILPGPGGDTIPLRIQQVFGSSDMTLPYGVCYVTGVNFRLTALVGGSSSSLNAVVPDIEMRLSTTYTVVDHLSSFFVNNTGSDETVVLPRGPLQVTGTYVPGQAVQPFSVHISFAEPFLFNHSPEKNLVLDIINYQGSSTRVAFDAVQLQNDSVSVVGSNRLTEGNSSTLGLVAQFEFREIPEPSVRVLLILAGCVCFLVHSRIPMRL